MTREVREIIMTRDQADAAKKRGLGALEYVAERFMQEHGLSFSPREIEDVSRFDHFKCLTSDIFKVVYKGYPNTIHH